MNHRQDGKKRFCLSGESGDKLDSLTYTDVVVRSSPAVRCSVALQSILLVGHGLLVSFGRIGSEDNVCLTQCFSNSRKKKKICRNWTSVCFGQCQEERNHCFFIRQGEQLSQHEDTEQGSVACFGCHSPWKGTEDLAPSALSEHMLEHPVGNGVGSANRCWESSSGKRASNKVTWRSEMDPSVSRRAVLLFCHFWVGL